MFRRLLAYLLKVTASVRHIGVNQFSVLLRIHSQYSELISASHIRDCRIYVRNDLQSLLVAGLAMKRSPHLSDQCVSRHWSIRDVSLRSNMFLA